MDQVSVTNGKISDKDTKFGPGKTCYGKNMDAP